MLSFWKIGGVKQLVISERHLAQIYPRLRRFARNRVGGDQSVADEILQNSILMAIEYFERTETEPISIEAWIKNRIVLNCKNYFKSLNRDKKRFGKQKLDFGDYGASVTASSKERPELIFDTENETVSSSSIYDIEEIADINLEMEDPSFTQKKNHCWSKLEAREREILEYSYGNAPFKTLEKVFGLSKKTLANILSRAKIQFIKCIKSQ